MSKGERTYLHYLEDILKSIDKILKYTEGMSFNDFRDNELVTDAVIRNFEIIGEASINVPDYIKETYPEISWKGMYGLRNLVVHEYFGIDYETIWTIITENLPDDKLKIEEIIENEQ